MNKCIINNRILTGLSVLCLYIFLQGCSVDRQVSVSIAKSLKKSAVLKQHYVGLSVYSLSEKKPVYQHNADRYFTPASNTKLFTFYGGLKMIKDRIPALRYIERGDSLIFWGTGDPSFLQTKLKGTATYELLRQSNKQLFYAFGRYSGGFYGKGWAWDDYNDYYQAEISDLPVMDNLVSIISKKGTLSVSPALFKNNFVTDSANQSAFLLIRDFNGNTFHHPASTPPDNYEQQVPYKVDPKTTLAVLADTLRKPISLISMKMPADAKTVYGVERDSVLKEMMLPSDNFIAEQLLLVYSDQLGQELSTEKAIAYITTQYLGALPNKPVWIDGSGLSRYNLFTPADMTKLLELIYDEVHDPEKLYALFPAGGKTGTLKNAYPKTDTPYVFGKTGSLSNVYNQSGYLVTKKGRTYIFSFMNNNFTAATAEVRKAMAELITAIHDKF